MLAIFKREMGVYFSSAIAYITLATFYCFSAIFFYGICLHGDNASLTGVFISMFLIIILIVPILTMKLISEEKKQKTDQALLTAPVSLVKIVLGKFFSACAMLAICFGIFLIYALVISCFVTPEWNLIICNMIGLYLLGVSLIAICLFMSSLTDNQVVAAILGFMAGMFIYMMDSIATLIPIEFVSNAITELSFINHMQNFSLGLFSITDIVFFFSIITVFIFLTVRVIEKKRWS